jgi:dihydrofolate synthase/folylpolyglutamate synthase
VSLKLQQALEALYGLERRRDKLGLEGIRALLGALGDPQRRFRAVHVAGTNGKGSVCALIERVLREAGHRTGLFTSPHLVDFRERIRVGGRWADEARLEARLAKIQSLPEGADRTFFEVCTALAFDDFADRGVEWAVVEVGLGGRLDCTNVLAPDVTVITSIGLDHTEILGGTLEAIAAEKAGIIQRGVPVVTGGLEAAAEAVVREVARTQEAPLRSAAGLAEAREGGAIVELRCGPAPWGGHLTLPIAMRGGRAAENASVAIEALATLANAGVVIPMAALRAGFARARWPGRFEPCPAEPRLWWDGAHNSDGIESLASTWVNGMAGAIVLALSRDKPADDLLRRLRSIAPGARLIVTRADHERALPADALADAALRAGWAVSVQPSVEDAVRFALDATAGASASHHADRVMLTGSLFAVGEAMAAFGGAPGEWQ